MYVSSSPSLLQDQETRYLRDTFQISISKYRYPFKETLLPPPSDRALTLTTLGH